MHELSILPLLGIVESHEEIIRKKILRELPKENLEKALNRDSYISEKRIKEIGDFMYEYTSFGEKAVMLLRSIGEKIWNESFTVKRYPESYAEHKRDIYDMMKNEDFKRLKIPRLREDLRKNIDIIIYDKIGNLQSLASVVQKNYNIDIVKKFAESLREFHDKGYTHNDPSLYTLSYSNGDIYYTLLNFAEKNDSIKNRAKDILGFYISLRFNSKRDDFTEEYIRAYNPDKEIIKELEKILTKKDGWKNLLYPFKTIYALTAFGVMPKTLDKYKKDLYKYIISQTNDKINK